MKVTAEEYKKLQKIGVIYWNEHLKAHEHNGKLEVIEFNKTIPYPPYFHPDLLTKSHTINKWDGDTLIKKITFEWDFDAIEHEVKAVEYAKSKGFIIPTRNG